MYQADGTKNRTVLVFRPWWPVDEQALPPFCWCEMCGAEVYERGSVVCRRCREEGRMHNAELRIENFCHSDQAKRVEETSHYDGAKIPRLRSG